MNEQQVFDVAEKILNSFTNGQSKQAVEQLMEIQASHPISAALVAIQVSEDLQGSRSRDMFWSLLLRIAEREEGGSR